MMINLFILLLCLLPFGNFIFNKLDIWHAQGHLFQVGLLILTSKSFFDKPKQIKIQNKPLGFFTLWAGLITAYYWYLTIVKYGQYAITIFFPFFNIICFLIFYKLCIEYLDDKAITKIFKYMSYAVFVVICYGILQKLKLDEFYRPLATPEGFNKTDELVGTIGNPMHFAGYLALCLPLFLRRKNAFNIIAIALGLCIIILCNSVGGIITALVIALYYTFITGKKKTTLGIILICILIAVIFNSYIPKFFIDSNRFETWKVIFEKFRERPITGAGLGILNAWNIKPVSTIWRHAHLEYFQVACEIGLIGLALLLWVIVDYWRRFFSLKKSTNLITISSIFLGFMVLSLFSFPAHLWLTASMGMSAYGFLFVIQNEEIKNGG